MAMDRADRLAFATTTEVVRVADYLSRIAAGLREGRVDLIVSGQALRLRISDVVRLELEAGRRASDGRASLGLEISWRSEAVPHDADPAAGAPSAA